MTIENKHVYHALLSFDGLHLSFPQHQVIHIELTDSIQYTNNEDQSIFGQWTYRGIDVPVFSLSAELHLLSELSPDRRFCVAFKIDEEPSFALACDAVESLLLEEESVLQPLPVPMITEPTPIRHLLRQGENLIYICDAKSMHSYLSEECTTLRKYAA
ncbi:MAG: hypothetical protein ABFS45_08545 [Pseudomonadota bacterium]